MAAASPTSSGLVPFMEEAQRNLQRSGLGIHEGPGKPERWPADGLNMVRSLRTQIGAILKQHTLGVDKRIFPDNVFGEHIVDKYVCELFGSGFLWKNPNAINPAILESISPKQMLGVRLGPYKRRDGEEDLCIPPEVCGDLFTNGTWQRVRDEMKLKAIPSMHLVYMRPLGGWDEERLSKSSENTADALTYITGNVINLLHPEGKFVFVILLRVEGDISSHPKIVQLISAVDTLSAYTLKVTATLSSDQTCTIEFSGHLAPKSKAP